MEDTLINSISGLTEQTEQEVIKTEIGLFMFCNIFVKRLPSEGMFGGPVGFNWSLFHFNCNPYFSFRANEARHTEQTVRYEMLAANKRRHIPEQLLCVHGNVILVDLPDLGRFEGTDRGGVARIRVNFGGRCKKSGGVGRVVWGLSCEPSRGSRPPKGRVPRLWHPRGTTDRQSHTGLAVMVTAAGTADPHPPPLPPPHPALEEVPDLWVWWEWLRGSGSVGESGAK